MPKISKLKCTNMGVVRPLYIYMAQHVDLDHIICYVRYNQLTWFSYRLLHVYTFIVTQLPYVHVNTYALLIIDDIESPAFDIYTFNDSIKPIQNIGLINCTVGIDTKEGQIHVLEINNALYFRNHMENVLPYINPIRAADVAVEDISPY